MKALHISKELLVREIVLDRIALRSIGVFCFVVFTVLGAYVRIPLWFTPVPLTLQTFFVILSGAVLGGYLGLASQLSYLFLGLAGLPVFTNAAYGTIAFCGPTGGYLIGFVVASGIIGALLGRPVAVTFGKVFLAMFLADLALLLCGTVWLAYLLKLDLYQALGMGLLPFLPGDLLKSLAASAVYFKIRKRTGFLFR